MGKALPFMKNVVIGTLSAQKEWQSEGLENEKKEDDFSYLPSFSLPDIIRESRHACDRTNKTCSIDTIGRCNDFYSQLSEERSAKYIAGICDKKNVWHGGKTGIEKKGTTGQWNSRRPAAQRWPGEEEAERYRSWGEFGKVDGRYYGTGVKNERDIKKYHPRSLCPPPRSRSAGQPLDKSEEKRKERC